MLSEATMRKLTGKNALLVFCGFICGLTISRYIMGSFGFGCRKSYFIHPKTNFENILTGNRHGSEIPKRSKIYVGMMSSAKYLSTRVQRNVDTWAQKGGWKIDVFTDPGSAQVKVPKHLNMHIITLPGVDDNAYPPQKKSFMLLRYMHDYHINDYEWFIRADDDSYTDFPRLERLLSKLNSSLPIFLGSPGFGMDEDDGIEEGMRYLMGGLGMILSRGLLIQLRPHIKYCIQHLYSPHEDIEIGRCVWKHTKAILPVAWELVDLFYQQYDKDTGDVSNIVIDQLTPKRTAKTVTYHAVKTPELMYRLHNQVLVRDMHTALNRTARLKNEIAHMEQMIELTAKTLQSENTKSVVIPLIPGPSNLWKDELWPADAHWYPANASFNKASFDVPWYYFDRYYRNDAKDTLVPKRGHSSVEKVAIADMLVDIESNLMQISCPNFPSNVQLNYGYMQTGSLDGVRIVTVHRSSAGSTIKFCRTISQISYGVVMSHEDVSIFQQHESVRKLLAPSAGLLERAMKDILAGGENADFDENENDHGDHSIMSRQSATHGGKIIFVIPLQGRYRALELFMERYERDFLIPGEKDGKVSNNLPVQLAIVLLGNDDQGDDLGLNLASAHLLKSYQNTYGSELLRYHVASTGDRGFSRGAGIQLGSLIGGEHDLLFFMDIDMIVTPDLAERCKALAHEGYSVWYPVSFSQYDPEKLCYNDNIDSTDKEDAKSSMRKAEMRNDKRSQREVIKQTPLTLNSNRGFWRDFGFGIACMHKADFIKTGGFDLSIEGWGEEDIRLFLSLLKAGIDVFRSRQVDLIHIFHQKYCDPNIPKEQSQACYRTRASHFASQRCLADMWEKRKA